MKAIKRVTPVVEINVQYIERVTDMIEDELGIYNLDMEQRESLQHVVQLSVGLYFLLIREANDKTSRLTQ